MEISLPFAMSARSGASVMGSPAFHTSDIGDDASKPTVFNNNNNNNILKFGFAVAIIICVFLTIVIIAISAYFCTHDATATNPRPPRRRRRLREEDDGHGDPEAELDSDDVLKSCPQVTYSEAKRRDPRVAGSCCSVCLADYGDEEVLRLLPECEHLFHERCVGQWLRRKPSCPVCRSSSTLSLLPAPRAEAVPLASSRLGIIV